MGFRFFRRIRIVPGLSLNLSKSGISASVGPRGGKLTVGPRGVTRSLGLPGTGLFWRDRIASGHRGSQRSTQQSRSLLHSSVSTDEIAEALDLTPEGLEVLEAIRSGKDGVTKTFKSGADLLAHWESVKSLPGAFMKHPKTGRSMTDAQVRAFAEKMDKDAALERLIKEIAQEEEELQQIIRYWNPLPPIPSWEEYTLQYEGIQSAPFPEAAPRPPLPPLESSVRLTLTKEQEDLLNRNLINRALPWLRNRKLLQAVEDLLPLRLEGAHAAYVAELAQHEKALLEHAAREAEWRETCLQEARHLYALMEGKDEALVAEAACAAIDSLALPFEADCRIMLNDDTSLFVDIDLPEIEDVVPESRRVANKNGTERVLRRKPEDRNDLYAELVIGHCLNICAQLFLSLPRLVEVTMAAYTQRKARKADDVDTYILEWKVGRDSLGQVAAEDSLDHARLLHLLNRFSSRYEILSSGAFRAIPRPAWTLDHDDKIGCDAG